MKRKYAALMLGLTLALSSTAAYAEESPASAEEVILEEDGTSENNSDLEDTSPEEQESIYGKVISINETSITIELASSPESVDTSTEDSMEDETPDTTASETELLSEDENLLAEELPNDASKEMLLEFDGVKQIFSITDDTVAILEQPILELKAEETSSEPEFSEESLTDTEELVSEEDTTELILLPNYEETESFEIELTDVLPDDLVQIELDEEGNIALITVIELQAQS